MHAKIVLISCCFSCFSPSLHFLKSLPCFSNPQATFLHSFRLWRHIRSQEKGSNINSGRRPAEPLDFLRRGQSILDFSSVFLINQSPRCAACNHPGGKSLLGRLIKHNFGSFADFTRDWPHKTLTLQCLTWASEKYDSPWFWPVATFWQVVTVSI